MNVAIVDCDLLMQGIHHNFPNLVSMKLSAFHKRQGDTVRLILSYDESFHDYDKIYVSKVFTSTTVPDWLVNDERTEIGGTGFFFDRAPTLPYEIEHIMPDYTLYNEWVNSQIEAGIHKDKLYVYTEYSIGFMTRGCFRHCGFCVNRNFNRCVVSSPIEEFFDPNRKRIMLLDDNFLACPSWRDLVKDLNALGRKVKFSQGLDARLLNEEGARCVYSMKIDGDWNFAFDNIEDREIITEKLEMFQRLFPNKLSRTKFYVLVGFDRNDKYDYDFWISDIVDMFERIKIIGSHRTLPYIMRYEAARHSPWKGFYAVITTWCNHVNSFKKSSFANFLLEYNTNYDKNYLGNPGQWIKDGKAKRQPFRILEFFRREYPDIYNEYFTFIGKGWIPQETMPY